MSLEQLIIEGARQNNLKGVSLRLPHDRVIVVTGVSGSGKSSLAFETVFAEGQWRFIESLSTYARLFLEKMDRPDVDLIDNIRPAIALEQRNPVKGSRTTVGTLTEIYDFLRLVYSKAATPYCPRCGEEVRGWDPASVRAELLGHHTDDRAMVTFRAELSPEEMGLKGFHRVLLEGEVVGIEDAPDGPPYEVVLDRLVIRDEPRLADSLEMAMKEGRGRLMVRVVDGPQLVFTSRNSCDHCGMDLPDPTPLLFSFNHPVGACPECKGFGNVLRYDERLIVPDRQLSIADGAIEPWEKPAAKWWKRQMLKWAKTEGMDITVPYAKLPKKYHTALFEGAEGFYGVNDFFQELESMRYKLHVRVFLSRYRKGVNCPSCGGKRLMPEALAYKIGGMDLAEMTGMPVADLIDKLSDLDLSPFQREVVGEPLRQVASKLKFLDRVGLGYLTLSREGKTLSGGEYQRINLSNQLASQLTSTLYVLDEPTVGLHARDTERITGILRELADTGNTILVVEHDRGVIERVDWVVELGPGGGQHGGEVVFSGPIKKFLKSGTLTARYMTGEERITPPARRRTGDGKLRLSGATGNNLRGIDLEVPLRTLSTVTGVSGSGKSTLVVETLYRALSGALSLRSPEPLPYDRLGGHERLKGVKLIDQSPIGRSPRSNPVTYLKVFDSIRKIFASVSEARSLGMKPGFFSFNVPGGRCEMCKGEGYQRVEMYFFEDLYIKCEDCDGKRYGRDALKVRYRDHTVHDVLQMTVDEALKLFYDSPQIKARLELMRDVGLGYLRLGQPATSLSGGEAQRLKICAELGVAGLSDILYVLDEPTVGLHMSDVDALLGVLGRLVDAGNTVLVIEHNLDVIAASDWVVDLGPEGGGDGGRVMYSGPPEGMKRLRKSHTARFLKQVLK